MCVCVTLFGAIDVLNYCWLVTWKIRQECLLADISQRLHVLQHDRLWWRVCPKRSSIEGAAQGTTVWWSLSWPPSARRAKHSTGNRLASIGPLALLVSYLDASATLQNACSSWAMRLLLSFASWWQYSTSLGCAWLHFSLSSLKRQDFRRRSSRESQSWALMIKCLKCSVRCTRHLLDENK